jgi:AbrB family looped-hinge helix DNA binding protein
VGGVIVKKLVKITGKCQITIPLAIRRVLGVSPGDILVFESDKDGVLVRPVRTESDSLSIAPLAIERWIREERQLIIG